MAIAQQFAHVLLFSCLQCGSPLASACASRKRNLEQAEAHWFKHFFLPTLFGNIVGGCISRIALGHAQVVDGKVSSS